MPGRFRALARIALIKNLDRTSYSTHNLLTQIRYAVCALSRISVLPPAPEPTATFVRHRTDRHCEEAQAASTRAGNTA